jgi:hypothetical protein
VKDEEIDSIVKKAAESARESDRRALESIAASIKASVRTSLRPVRPLPPAWLLTGLIALVCAAIALAGAAHAGFFGFEKMDVFERLLICIALGALTLLTASHFVGEMIPGSKRRASAAVLLLFTVAVMLAIFALLFRDYQTSHFVSAGLACLLTGLLFAIPAGLVSWLVLRRGFAVNPVSAGLSAGILAGLAGVAMLELHCPNFQAAHILVWHTAVVPVSGALGALLGWALQLRASSDGR